MIVLDETLRITLEAFTKNLSIYLVQLKHCQNKITKQFSILLWYYDCFYSNPNKNYLSDMFRRHEPEINPQIGT